MENKLIQAALQSREIYEKLVDYEAYDDFSDRGKLLFDEIREFYTTDPEAQAVDTEILESALSRKYPKHIDVFRIFLSNSTELSGLNVVRELVELRKHELSLRLSAAFAQGDDDEIDSLLAKYNKYKSGELDDGAKEEIYHNVRVTDLVYRTTGDNRIKLLPRALNDQVDGGALRGHHVLVFARPEMGKSLFVLNMAAGFLVQGLGVLYVGNEDPAQDLILRLVQRLAGMDKYQIREDPELAHELAMEKGYENFYFRETEAGTITQIETWINETSPDVLIVDQVSNLKVGNRQTSQVQQLEMACKGVRSLGKRHNLLVVSVTQAGDSADNKIMLEMGDIHGSNTGMQATADLMIGIGGNQDMVRQGLRMLSFPKNKIGTCKDALQVVFNQPLTKVE